MKMIKDEWFSAALTDDAVVAELLFHLKSSSSAEVSMTPALLPPVSWGLRLPRSKLSRKDSTTTTTTARFSPTTPLSWSGGAAASPSDGAYDESSTSRGASSDPIRSKFNISSIDNQRSKKKKKFSELQEEESEVLNDNIHFKRELASSVVNLKSEVQRGEGKNSKRIKIDLNEHSGAKSGKQMEFMAPHRCKTFSSSFIKEEDKDVDVDMDMDKETTNTRGFVLPDLNMVPEEHIL